MSRLMLLAVMAAVALSLSSVPVLQLSAHAEGMASDSKAAAKGTASDTKEADTKSGQGAVSDSRTATTGTDPSLMDKAGKVKTDAGKTKDSATSPDLSGTSQGASDTKQSGKVLKDSATDVMKNPFGK